MSPPAPKYSVEPLGNQDRTTFDCGVPELDRYLHQQARQDIRRKVAAVFVMVDSSGGLAGYYTLSSYGIRPAELPPEAAKRLPKYPLIPATLLGRLAVSRERRGQKLGRLLLMDAFFRSLKNTAEVASVGVVVEAYNDAARAFYRHHEFIPLSEQPNRLFIAMETIQKAFS